MLRRVRILALSWTIFHLGNEFLISFTRMNEKSLVFFQVFLKMLLVRWTLFFSIRLVSSLKKSDKDAYLRNKNQLIFQGIFTTFLTITRGAMMVVQASSI
mmetsp:Transcript_4843/g.8310  ORF Transcript_4843/g.8310 Transcript_4843/m.8310 type:complete len:100 (+) Transcript_4843:692-991(+)